jgi:hypothetical protein
MKLRAIGAGSPFCRHPLVPACWLIQTHGSCILIGCPPQLPARLEALDVALEKIDMIIPLGVGVSQIGGLDEIGHYFSSREEKPYLACPERLLSKVLGRLEYPTGFQYKAVTKIGFTEEHITETLTFVDNYGGGFGFRLEEAKIFVSGDADVNEDWLFKEMACEVILHCDRQGLADLPLYLQNKIWIYGYQKAAAGTDPLPMLYLPQNAFVYDSDRRDKVLSKNRFIRENTKRVIGNDRPCEKARQA